MVIVYNYIWVLNIDIEGKVIIFVGLHDKLCAALYRYFYIFVLY